MFYYQLIHIHCGSSGGRSRAASSPPALSESGGTCVLVGQSATGSGPTWPAGLAGAVAGRRPSYPSRIRVFRAVYEPCHFATCHSGQRCDSATQTFHVVGPVADLRLALVIRVCFLGCLSQTRWPSDASPMIRHGPRLRVAGPSAPSGLIRGGPACPGPRSGRPLRSGGVVGSRARLSATGVGGRLKFVIATRSESLRSLVFGPLALRDSVGSACDGTVCRAAPVAALLGRLADCPRLNPAVRHGQC